MKWSQNDELFLKELKAGHQWQKLPGMYFKLHGLEVAIPKLQIRDDIAQAGNWINTTDLQVNGCKLEVKSRNERFCTPVDFPYSTILVDTVAGYDGKIDKPLAYIMVSRPTGGMLFLWSDSSDRWITDTKFDNVRKIRDKFYLAPKESLMNLDEILPVLKRK